MDNLEKSCNVITDMASKDIKSRVFTIGHSNKADIKSRKNSVQLDPLKPTRWKNEEGTKFRREMNAKARERKQDLCIMIDTICNKPAAANAFHKIVMPGKRTMSKP